MRVVHQRLMELLTHFGVYIHLVNSIASFGGERTISLEFDGQREPLTAFHSGLPQGYLLSPVLFVIYAAGLNPSSQQPLNRHATSYVDDELMTQRCTSQKGARIALQERLDARIAREEILNIKFSPAKAELMHLL